MYYSDPKPGLIAQVDGDIVPATRQDTFGPTPHSEIAVTPARADAARWRESLELLPQLNSRTEARSSARSVNVAVDTYGIA